MKAFLFYFAFVWTLTSIGSLIVGPFIGLDRPALRRQLFAFWDAASPHKLGQFLRRAALMFAWVGFLFPAAFPLFGLVVAIVFVLFI